MSEIQVQLHDEAREELELAAEWYEQRRPFLGDDFVDAVESGVRSLRAGQATLLPTRHVPSVRQIRRMHIARFPYQLFVVGRGTGYLVLAVAHHRRRPGYWLPRLVK